MAKKNGKIHPNTKFTAKIIGLIILRMRKIKSIENNINEMYAVTGKKWYYKIIVDKEIYK